MVLGHTYQIQLCNFISVQCSSMSKDHQQLYNKTVQNSASACFLIEILFKIVPVVTIPIIELS